MVAKISEILTRAPSLNSCSRWLLGSSGKRIGNEVESIDEEKTPFRQDLFRLTYLTKKGAFFFSSCQLVLSLSQHRPLSIHKPCGGLCDTCARMARLRAVICSGVISEKVPVVSDRMVVSP